MAENVKHNRRLLERGLKKWLDKGESRGRCKGRGFSCERERRGGKKALPERGKKKRLGYTGRTQGKGGPVGRGTG